MAPLDSEDSTATSQHGAEGLGSHSPATKKSAPPPNYAEEEAVASHYYSGNFSGLAAFAHERLGVEAAEMTVRPLSHEPELRQCDLNRG